MSRFNNAQLHTVMEKLRTRSRLISNIGFWLAGTGIFIGVLSFIAMGFGNLEAPVEGISRVQLSPAMLEVLALPVEVLKDGAESAIVYVGHSGLIGHLLNTSLWLGGIALFVMLATVSGVIAQSRNVWLSNIACLGIILSFLLAVMCGITFIVAPAVVNSYVYDESNQTSISVRKSRHIPRETGEAYQDTIDALEEAQLTEGMYLQAQYAIAQLAQRAEAEDADAQSKAFLEAYAEEPQALGFEPIDQHLYSLEMTAYGEPRSELSLEYAARRTEQQDTPSFMARLWPWTPGTLLLLALPMLTLGQALQNRVARLTTLLEGESGNAAGNSQHKASTRQHQQARTTKQSTASLHQDVPRMAVANPYSGSMHSGLGTGSSSADSGCSGTGGGDGGGCGG